MSSFPFNSCMVAFFSFIIKHQHWFAVNLSTTGITCAAGPCRVVVGLFTRPSGLPPLAVFHLYKLSTLPPISPSSTSISDWRSGYTVTRERWGNAAPRSLVIPCWENEMTQYLELYWQHYLTRIFFIWKPHGWNKVVGTWVPWITRAHAMSKIGYGLNMTSCWLFLHPVKYQIDIVEPH